MAINFEIDLPEERLEGQLPDHKPPLTAHEVVAEANRCLYCFDAPCTAACPTSVDVSYFIGPPSTENIEGAAKTILQSNILGYSCARVCPVDVLCEGSCVYHQLNEKPIAIGRLQRHATEFALDTGLRIFTPGPDSGRRVALIGAGPASLACAFELRLLGHSCVLFEARPTPGGLNTNGIAPYKLPAADAIREVDHLLDIGGIELRMGAAVGTEVTIGELLQDFDAVFVGVGLGLDTPLSAAGAEVEGVVGAVEWIERMKLEGGYTIPGRIRSVAVIGGGNSALDVVREMVELGIENVTLVYRRDEAGMPGYGHEWVKAKQWGARGLWNTLPSAVLSENGAVTGLRCVKTRLVANEGGRASVETIAGSEFELQCEMVVAAIGQSKLTELFGAIPGLELDGGKVVIDVLSGQTANEKVFAGGDCVNGGKEVVNAAHDGKVAARGIDAYFKSLQ